MKVFFWFEKIKFLQSSESRPSIFVEAKGLEIDHFKFLSFFNKFFIKFFINFLL